MLFLTKNSQFADRLHSQTSNTTKKLTLCVRSGCPSLPYLLLPLYSLSPPLSPLPFFLFLTSTPSFSYSHGTQRPTCPLSPHLHPLFSFLLLSLLLSWDLAPSLPSLSSSPLFLLLLSSSLSCSHGTQRPPCPLSLHLHSFSSLLLPLSLALMGPSALPLFLLLIFTSSLPPLSLSCLVHSSPSSFSLPNETQHSLSRKNATKEGAYFILIYVHI